VDVHARKTVARIDVWARMQEPARVKKCFRELLVTRVLRVTLV
jgi:hypothetical protein